MRTGYLEALAGWQQRVGAYARVEAGARLTDSLGAFAFGQYDQTFGASAGVGARLTFGLP